MNPQAHRCCQHNVGAGWPYFAQTVWMATPGNGLAAVMYSPSAVTTIANPKRRAFAGMLSAADDAVGAVLAKMREQDLEENTLVFFLSDNGGPTSKTTSRNTPLNGFRGMAPAGGIRVPVMAQWKGRLPAGQVDDGPVIALDVLPTALATAGVPPPADAKAACREHKAAGGGAGRSGARGGHGGGVRAAAWGGERGKQ